MIEEKTFIAYLVDANQTIGSLQAKLDAANQEIFNLETDLMNAQNGLSEHHQSLERRLRQIRLDDVEALLTNTCDKIQAIRLYRAVSGEDLRASKEYVYGCAYFNKGE